MDPYNFVYRDPLRWRPSRRPEPQTLPPEEQRLPLCEEQEEGPAGRPRRGERRWHLAFFVGGIAIVLFLLFGMEIRTSRLQAEVLSRVAKGLSFQVEPGPSERIRFPGASPYDERMGYTRLSGIFDSLASASFAITAQAQISPQMAEMVDLGVFPIYHEKAQAGLHLTDRRGQVLYDARFPGRVYPTFEAIPPLVWQTLLYIENRELLDPRYPYRNPAVEWDRFSRAVLDQGLQALGVDRSGPGASTLATQLEKFRHSPGGLTDTPREKLRQMASASLRSYRDGPRTEPARRQIVASYLNAVPLAALPGYGEVIGLGDGLWAWYGADFARVNRLLEETEPSVSAETGAAYRQVLSLILATRRPSFYLTGPAGHAALAQKTDTYLRLLAAEGVISPALRDAALAAELGMQEEAPEQESSSFIARKAVNAVRYELLRLLDVTELYSLDRYDLSARTTFDREVQAAVSAVLEKLDHPDSVRAAGLVGYRLLGEAVDLARVTYAVVLYEAAEEGNLVRLQADNYEGPFNINEGTKLELGSTAKLRTLVNYFEVVEALYGRLAPLPEDELQAVPVHRTDRITGWAKRYLLQHPESTLSEILEAALDRSYSASPAETFFTAGGVHVFHNFSSDDDGRVLSVREAFRHSVNLVFIRLMRDLVHHYTAALPGSPADMLDDPEDPRRAAYLSRFADQEGRQFLYGFYRKYQGKAPAEALEAFASSHRLTPRRLAWAFRSIEPQAGVEAFAAFLEAQGLALSEQQVGGLFEGATAAQFSWQDRGYLAGVHPLELWLLAYLRKHPEANWSEVAEAGAQVRQEVYAWLFQKGKEAQDRRIRTLLEEDAFAEIHRHWKRLGYPFDALIPSYATSIGTSADRPGALTELVGIILRGGMRYPVIRIRALHFAEGTPYETVLQHQPEQPVRVLSPEVAAAVRAALVDIVEQGTARRARGAVLGPDGQPLVIGGKTGTGDNRMKVVGPGGAVQESEATSRTSTLVFFVGDRFFGTITVYVAGPEAARYGFTSSLPAQLLRVLGPELTPLFATSADAP